MSKLFEFVNFLRDRRIATSDFDEFVQQLIEPIKQTDGALGYRVKPLSSTEKITQRCNILVYYTWHCRDYVKKVVQEAYGVDASQLVNNYIKKSRDIQIVSYLANSYKHAGADHTQKWAVDIAPRFAKPYALGIMFGFPSHIKPMVRIWGESIPEFEFVGSASVGEQKFQFTDFKWSFSCTIENKNGEQLGNVLELCENTFATWIQVLGEYGITIPA